jgi:hemoglobin-like flavoprotein
MIAFAANSLDRPDELAATLRGIGVRHAGAGVRPDHYTAAGVALVWTLEKTLPQDFTPAVKSAWSSVYTLVARHLLEGLRSATVPA